MINVLHITARADMGGGPRHIQYLLNGLAKFEIINYVACPNDKPFLNIYSEMLGEGNTLQIPHRKFSFASAKKLNKFIRDKGINIVHCHGKGAATYGKFAKILNRNIKLIYTPHGIHVSEYGKLQKRLYRLYESFTSWLFSHVIYVSDSESAVARKEHLFTAVNYSVIPNGVPSANESIIDVNAQKQQIFHNNHIIILTLSRFDFQKNMHEAMAIARELPECNFLWIGNGEDFTPLKEQVEKNGIKNIYLAGAKTDVSQYLAISDIYLSTARWEGMPLALLEAMSYGMPIIASNVVGNRDVIHDRNGCLYELGNIKEAVEAIKLFKSNPTDKDSIKRIFKEKYSSDIMSGKIFDVYKKYL